MHSRPDCEICLTCSFPQDGTDDPEALPPGEQSVKDVSVESSTANPKEGEEEGREEEEEEEGRGFGGIRMRSVTEIIAKARADEDFFSATTMAGLSNRIEDLVKLVDGENEEDGIYLSSLPFSPSLSHACGITVLSFLCSPTL